MLSAELVGDLSQGTSPAGPRAAGPQLCAGNGGSRAPSLGTVRERPGHREIHREMGSRWVPRHHRHKLHPASGTKAWRQQQSLQRPREERSSLYHEEL